MLGTNLKPNQGRIKWHDIPAGPNAAQPSPAEPKVDESAVTRPQPVSRVRLPEYENLQHVRLGKWRVSYAVDGERLIILVLELIPPEEHEDKIQIKWLNFPGR